MGAGLASFLGRQRQVVGQRGRLEAAHVDVQPVPNASIANTIATGFTNSVAVSVRANNSPSMTVLSNGVITLRRPTAEDAAEMAAAVQESLAELEPWMPWASSRYDEAAAREWIANQSEYAFVIIDTDGAVVGTCGLNAIDEMNKRANLGYWLRTDCTGRGLATAATRLLATHALEDLEFLRLEISMSIDNHASRGVAERAGAAYEGVLRSRLLLHGQIHDAHSFAITANRPSS